VLDGGCGTATRALTVIAAEPTARVTGLDPDGSALRRAARKARRRGVSLELVQGFADRLPLEDGSVDHVLSALALHHVEGDDSAAFAREALRVLRPGGTVTIVDVGGGAGDHDHEHGHGRSGWLRRRHGHPIQDLPTVARNRGDGIPALLREAGFADAHEVDHAEHRFGRITFVQATRPE
jgi:SAM-dependent methyltransferase